MSTNYVLSPVLRDVMHKGRKWKGAKIEALKNIFLKISHEVILTI